MEREVGIVRLGYPIGLGVKPLIDRRKSNATRPTGTDRRLVGRPILREKRRTAVALHCWTSINSAAFVGAARQFPVPPAPPGILQHGNNTTKRSPAEPGAQGRFTNELATHDASTRRSRHAVEHDLVVGAGGQSGAADHHQVIAGG